MYSLWNVAGLETKLLLFTWVIVTGRFTTFHKDIRVCLCVRERGRVHFNSFNPLIHFAVFCLHRCTFHQAKAASGFSERERERDFLTRIYFSSIQSFSNQLWTKILPPPTPLLLTNSVLILTFLSKVFNLHNARFFFIVSSDYKVSFQFILCLLFFLFVLFVAWNCEKEKILVSVSMHSVSSK